MFAKTNQPKQGVRPQPAAISGSRLVSQEAETKFVNKANASIMEEVMIVKKKAGRTRRVDLG